MGAGRKQRETAAVENYQLESEKGKHLKSPQIRHSLQRGPRMACWDSATDDVDMLPKG